MRVIGMMSGTSFDAVDAAAADITIEGSTAVVQPLGMLSQPYSTPLRDALVAALPPASTTMEGVCRLDTGVGQTFAELAARANRDLCDGRAELVVAHGQTVHHWIEEGRVLGTLQVGEPAWIAERTGVPVVADLRSRDVAAGGQGAPLVSAFDVLWLTSRGRASAALNLGGIANVTILRPGTEPVAFDTGPANALIDATVQRATDGRATFDADGARAASGRVRADVLQVLLEEPYFQQNPPKSTGKELFNLDYLDRIIRRSPPIDTDDLVATLTALTAETVAAALLEAQVEEVIASGGGTLNPVLMHMLRERLPRIPVIRTDDLGLPATGKEAYAFGYLGFATVSGLTSTIPSCTGARHASLLGSVTPGRAGLPVVERAAQQPTSLEVRAARGSDVGRLDAEASR